FLVSFDGERDDQRLYSKLEAEAEGILAWAVEGCLEWRDGGLKTPDKVLAATKQYRAEQDVLGQFIAEDCVLGLDYRETSRNLFEGYLKWCAKTRNKEISFGLFTRKLTERQFEQKDSGGKCWRLGIVLRAEESDSPPEDGGVPSEPEDLPF